MYSRGKLTSFCFKKILSSDSYEFGFSLVSLSLSELQFLSTHHFLSLLISAVNFAADDFIRVARHCGTFGHGMCSFLPFYMVYHQLL